MAGPKRGANGLQVLDELQLAVVGCCTEGEMLKHVCDPALSLLLLERAHAHGEPQRDALLRLVVLFDVIAQAAGKAAASDVRVLRQRHGCARDQQWLEVLEGARRRCVVVLFCLRVVLLRRLHRGGGGGGGVLLRRLLVVVARAVVASPRRGAPFFIPPPTFRRFSTDPQGDGAATMARGVSLSKASPSAKHEASPPPPRLSQQSGSSGSSLPAPLADNTIAITNADLKLLGRNHCHWWVIDPRKVTFVAHWDLAMTLALFYVALVTPVEVAFIKSPAEAKWANSIFLFNRLLDVMFIADMLLQFRLGYKEE